MLVLRGVAALHVTERRVGRHDPDITQVLQGHQVLGLPQPVQPAVTEGQGAEVLVHDSQQGLGALQPQGNVTHVVVLHVVGALHVIVDQTPPSGAEGLDRKELAFLHASSVTTW